MARADAGAWKPTIGWWTTVPVVVLLALAAYFLLPRFTRLEDTLGTLRQLRWWAVALALGSQGAAHLGGGILLQQVARLTGDRLSLWHCVRLGLAASSIGLVAGGPLGYAAATSHWLRKQKFSKQGATLIGWLPALLNAAAIVVLAVLGLLQLLVGHGIRLPGRISLLVLAAAAAIFTMLLLPLLSSEQRLASIAARVRRFWARLRRHAPDAKALQEDRERIATARRVLGRGGWRGVVLGVGMRTGFDILSLYFLFLAVDHGIALGTLLAGYGLPLVAGRVAVVVPGGVGLVEGGMVGLYRALGVPAAVAVVAVLAYRALSFWLPTLVGFPLAFLEQRRPAQPASRRD